MKTNLEKCYLLKNISRSGTIKIGENTISNSRCEKLLGVKFDSQLNFNNHLETIIKKASEKVMFWLELRLMCVFQKES